jgi:hypothetical protein
MNVQQTLHTLMYLPPKKSVLIESNHGLGKSQVVAQAAAMMSRLLKKPFGFIDFRLAQCEVGDLIGMMRHAPEGEVRRRVFKDGEIVEEMVLAQNVTIHDIAEWFPQDPDSCGYLFLDELFRAPRDVQNAVFELALDYRYHFKSLPIGWRVIAASNDNMDIYSGTLPDPALYDRFLKIQFKPTVPEWLKYADNYGTHKAITTYINKIPADLMPESKNIRPGEISPSPRSWISLSDCLIYMADQDQDPLKDENYLTLLCKGYLGKTVAINFVDYVKKNYKIYSPEDILDTMNKNSELKEFFESIEPAECAYYSKEIVKYIAKLGKLTNSHSKNLFLWMKTVNKEIASGFWSVFVGENKTKAIARKWYSDTEGVQDYIYGFLAKDKALKE